MLKQPAVVDRPSLSETEKTEIIAAVDLGSNSFHMIVAELRHGQLAVIDRIRETVRLAEGLSSTGDISDDARERALDCLSRFGQRLWDLRAGRVRAAGTSTIRRAREDTSFMAEAEARLGHPIDVISGIEEARLVYEGVSHSMPPTSGLRLVADIGGGSTEVILGKSAEPQSLESLHMGCVAMTETFFGDGRISRERFDAARLAAQLELRPVKEFFRKAENLQIVGTSGTIRAAATAAQSLGLLEAGLTAINVEKLVDNLLEFPSIEELTIDGLSARRAQVWPGGLAILAALFRTLRIDVMQVSDGALREGLLYDLLGRQRREDARERTVRSMALRYDVDPDQAARVAESAIDLFRQCCADWDLDDGYSEEFLDWAARLHEIGLAISHDGYQRHGAYIAEHADMPGFPRAEQRFLALLIRNHRQRIDRSQLQALPETWRLEALRLAVILRLAVLLHRNRSDVAIQRPDVKVNEDTIALRFNSDWLAANPLTIADLKREKSHLDKAGISLDIE